MCFSTNNVSSVMLRPKMLEIRNKFKGAGAWNSEITNRDQSKNFQKEYKLESWANTDLWILGIPEWDQIQGGVSILCSPDTPVVIPIYVLK